MSLKLSSYLFLPFGELPNTLISHGMLKLIMHFVVKRPRNHLTVIKSTKISQHLTYKYVFALNQYFTATCQKVGVKEKEYYI